MIHFFRKQSTFLFVFIFVAIFVCLSLGSALRESLTFDEVVHLQEGMNAWKYHTFAIDTNNPPLIREIQVIPLLLHIQSLIPSQQPNLQILPARMMTILFGILLLLLLFFTVKKYSGFPQAVIAGLLFSLEPTILGNSHYVTQDIGVTLIFFATYITLLSMNFYFSFKKLFLFSVLLGLGCASKITFIPFFLFSLLLFGLYSKRRHILQAILLKRNLFIFSFIICVLIIWTTYFFKTNVIIVERQDSTRVSAKLLHYAQKTQNKVLSSLILFTEKQPVPLGDYLGVLKNIAIRSISRDTSCFFLGKIDASCPRYAIFVNLLVKLPIPLIIFSLVGSFVFWKKHTKEEMYLLIPFVGIIVSSLLFPLGEKVRYILPLYPFIIILACYSWLFWNKTYLRFGIFLLLIVWYMVTSLQAFPHFLSYANTLTFGQKTFLLSDSNMDWGQSLPDAANFIQSQKIGTVHFSYFGRDNGDLYDLKSDKAYGSYKNNEICAYHIIKKFPNNKQVTIISSTNWYTCGYNHNSQFTKNKVKKILGDTLLVF